ncbi:MAG: Calx-beta domain-containing protein [Chloroflexota bacterium]
MKRQPILTRVVALLLALTCLYAGPIPAAHAATIVVNTTDDELNTDSDSSLREAIQAANTDTAVSGCTAGSGADTITLPAGLYTLTIAGTNEEDNGTGDLDITDRLTINGDGEGISIIQAGTNSTNGIDRVLDIRAFATVEINDVRIRYGRATFIAGETHGGGIRNVATLTLNNCTISSNNAPSSGAYGGGIENSGTLTLNNSTVGYNNARYRGGGACNRGTAEMTLNNSTVNGNTSGDRGGGIHNLGTMTLDNCTVSGNSSDGYGGGISTNGTLTSIHTSIANNIADGDDNGSGEGGGINIGGGTANVMNTIIGRNQDRSGEAHDCSGTLTSQGYNLLEWTAGCTLTPATGNVTGLNPHLGLLAENGGSTRTHALQTGSPAIEQIPRGTNGCESGVSTDQRGYPRAREAGYGGSRCDIGAYEYDTGPPLVRFSLESYSVHENGGSATITVVLNAVSGNPVTVDYATSNGTATAGSDYTSSSGTLSFVAGVTSRTFTVPITDDGVDEADETVVLTLSNAWNATIGGTNPNALTIEDDDPLPSVSFSEAAYSVDEGVGSASIAVNLSAPSGRLVEVDCATSDGTATAGSDYTASSARVYFYPGDTSKPFAVPIVEDAVDEANETVRLTLSHATNATIGGTNPATLTIVDNDGADVFIYLPLTLRNS